MLIYRMKNIAPGVCVKGFIRRFSVVLHQKKQIDKIDIMLREIRIILDMSICHNNYKRENDNLRDNQKTLLRYFLYGW
ncbi:hypothetical protein C6H72_07645 [Salmonella enterica subsp. diarizonae serovar 48:i:z]|nr:hypothetical protein C6H72_07645 [Salmonella enterica subsp. diarizonae serovar 48:i:z]RLR26350.1 hypothetical protein C6H71_13020 [Salmonella enterica subsp. diarizonae serovar 48:i:z]